MLGPGICFGVETLSGEYYTETVQVVRWRICISCETSGRCTNRLRGRAACVVAIEPSKALDPTEQPSAALQNPP